jgi:sugar phosphate isomerase/epimerase
MRLAMSTISTVGASFDEDIEAYADAGFDAIGLWEFKLPADDIANRTQLRERRLAVSNCVPAVPSILQLRIPGMEGPADPQERIEAICESVRRLAAYEPESVLFLSGPRGELSEADAHDVVADGAARIAATARDCGVRIGLEPVHPSQREDAGFVSSVADAARFLDALDLPDVGIMLDTYHVWDDPDALGWIAANVGRVCGLHVCDVTKTPGHGRALPGEVGQRAQQVAAALVATGWDGSLDVEIFSTQDRFWGLPVREAARQAHAAVARLRDVLTRP